MAADSASDVAVECRIGRRKAGWGQLFGHASGSRETLLAEIHSRLQLPGSELVWGAGGIADGIPTHLHDATLPKFRPDGILLVHAGGGAGLFSAMVGGWANGEMGSQPVTHRVVP